MRIKQKKDILRKSFLILLLTQLLYLFNFAQDFLIHNYTGADGLPSSEVYGAVQDQWGRMWFATRSGICRYDGLNWKTYDVDDGLPTTSFIFISIDARGHIWAVPHARHGGLFLVNFNGDHWLKINRMANEESKIAIITSFGLIKDTGLVNPGKDEPAIAIGTRDYGVFLWHLGKWTHLTVKKGLAGNHVTGIGVIKNRFYLSTSGGLSTLTLGIHGKWLIDNQLNQTLKLPDTNLRSIASDPANSKIWLLGVDWLGFFKIGKDTPGLVQFSGPAEFPLDRGKITMLPDGRGGLYASMRNGMIHYFHVKSRKWQWMGMKNGFVADGANSIFKDFEQNIWFCTDRGISKLVSRRFGNFRIKNGLLEDEVTVVLEYEPGKFMLGHNKGVTFWDGKMFSRYPFAGKLQGNIMLCRILDAKADSRQNIWLALDDGGVARIDSDRRLSWFGMPHGLPSNITSLWLDPGDRVWVGTRHGIFRQSGNRFIYEPIDGFPNPNIRKIFGRGRELGYLATFTNGLLAYDKKMNRWENYRLPGISTANSIFAVKEDSKGRILLGTRAGLFVITKRNKQTQYKPQRFSENGFQIEDSVYFIVEDSDNRLWLGTSDGVVRWDGHMVRHYSVPQGLAGRETNRAAGMIDSLGRLWIGTNRGVSIYNEIFDIPPSQIPPPRIKLLSMETEHISLALEHSGARNSDAIHLLAGTRALIFHFLGISFQNERAVIFKYKLDGLDEKWMDLPAQSRMIRYSNLAPGSYKFMLKAANMTGQWSENVSTSTIVIPAHFYQQWWFYLLLLLIAGMVLIMAVRYFTQKRYATLLEQKVEDRSSQLEALEKRYRNLFEDSRDVVFIAHPDGTFIDINPAGAELFGYVDRQDVLDQHARISFYNEPEDRVIFEKAIRKIGFVKSFDTILRNNSGERIHVRVTASLVKDESGTVTAYRGIIRDISEQKKLEQQLLQAQKMEAIGTLAGGIAHDFNNILGVIVGYSDLLVEDLPKDSIEYRNAKSVLAAANRATDLVKQILAFSRQSERKRKPLQLSFIVLEALKLLRSSLPTTIEIKRHIRARTALVLADATQMHQVIMNLCTNAAHAMKQSGGVLTVNLDEITLDVDAIKQYDDIAPGSYIKLTVEDTGHGIPKVVLKRIFEPYFTTKSTGEGTGMGLAVIHGIVKGHGGDISVLSEPGKGSVFTVLLPKIKVNQSEELLLKDEETTGGNESILLIDDETSLIQVGKQMLERMGYNVSGQSDAAHALELFNKDPSAYDLVITDLTMPGLTGIHIAEQVKRIKPGIPVILCSGFSSGIFEEEITTYVDDFVMKPIIRAQLARIIRNLLDKRKA